MHWSSAPLCSHDPIRSRRQRLDKPFPGGLRKACLSLRPFAFRAYALLHRLLIYPVRRRAEQVIVYMLQYAVPRTEISPAYINCLALA